MEQNKLKKLFHRHIQKKSNETETALVNAWYKSYQYKENEIVIDQEEKEFAKKSLQQQLEVANRKTIKPYLFRFAAAVVIICTTGGLLMNWKNIIPKQPTEYTTLITQASQIKKITLPDSSIVWLNAASKIHLNTNFEGSTREVFLDEGEAYFEVTKNPNKPFIVHSADIRIKVLGTSFNVRAYRQLSAIKISVATGSVQVNHQISTLAVLKPKQQLTYDKLSETFTKSEYEIQEVKGWREGKIYLHQASFKELQLILENNFSIHLKPGKKEVNNYQFTLNFHSMMSKNEIVKIISTIHNSKVRKEGNDMILY